MVNLELINLLRCPVCVKTTGGLMDFHKNTWLLCPSCDRKYPIVEDIPILLIDEGDKWVKVAIKDLPFPPPMPGD
jgi:uncharacterized protein